MKNKFEQLNQKRKISINEKYESKQKEIYDYRKSKPTMKYSDEEGFFEWKTKIKIINKSI